MQNWLTIVRAEIEIQLESLYQTPTTSVDLGGRASWRFASCHDRNRDLVLCVCTFCALSSMGLRPEDDGFGGE